jgi:hypothetical protein
MLESGLDITLHGTRALNAVVECDTSAGDKLAGHTLGKLYGLTLHFSQRQSVARLVVNLERCYLGNPEEILVLAFLPFHSLLLPPNPRLACFFNIENLFLG